MKKNLPLLIDLFLWITGIISVVFISGMLLWVVGVIFYGTYIEILNIWFGFIAICGFLALRLLKMGLRKK